MSLGFFLTSMVVILLPGTGVLYTLAVGLGRGPQRWIPAQREPAWVNCNNLDSGVSHRRSGWLGWRRWRCTRWFSWG